MLQDYDYTAGLSQQDSFKKTTEAAKQIQRFFRDIQALGNLKRIIRSYFDYSITEFRRREIASTISNPAKDKTKKFVEHAYGIKMAAKRITTHEQDDVIDPQNNFLLSPTYMRLVYEQAIRDVDEAYKRESLLLNKNSILQLNIVLELCENIKKEYIKISDLEQIKKTDEIIQNITKAINAVNEIPEGSTKVIRFLWSSADQDKSQIANTKSLLNTSGATPSYYSVIHTLVNNQDVSTQSIKELKVKFSGSATLQQLMDTTQTIKQLFLFKRHKNILVSIAIKLVEQLKIFKDQETILADLLNQQFFYVINSFLKLMYTYKDNNKILNNLYEILMEEIAAVLMYNGNPDAQEYTDILTNLYSKRLPVLDKKLQTHTWGCNNFLTSSGMGSILTVLYILGQNQEIYFTKGMYYEVYGLAAQLKIKFAKTPSKVIFTILNLSSPVDSVNIADIEEMINKQTESLKKSDYITLIIDNTIEYGSPEENKLQQLLINLQRHVDQGALNIILVKSLQKYTLLGTAKVMAGNISIINNQDVKFAEVKKAISQYSNSQQLMKDPEYQFLSYLLQHAGQFETQMADTATANAEYLKTLLATSEFLSLVQIPQSPFVVFNYGSAIYNTLTSYAKIAFREGFAFTHCSLGSVYDDKSQAYYRLCVGIEPKEILIEKFFMFNILKKHNDTFFTINIAKAAQIISQISMVRLNEALILTEQEQNHLLERVKEMFSFSRDNHENNKLFSILFCFLYSNDQKLKDFAKKLINIIVTTPMIGLSTVAKRYLVNDVPSERFKSTGECSSSSSTQQSRFFIRQPIKSRNFSATTVRRIDKLDIKSVPEEDIVSNQRRGFGIGFLGIK